jgi:hypothetical protein
MEAEKLSKAEQARINGAKSKGPTTPEGLQRCRQASVKHGMWVAQVSTLGHEAKMEYAALLTAANDQFRPRNCVEANIVGLLVDALWRAGRLGALANSDIDRQMWLIGRQANVEHESYELHLLAEQASKSVSQLEARARHYTREISRYLDLLKKLQNFAVSTEASQVLSDVIDLHTKEAPEPPTEAPKTVPKPAAESIKPAPAAEPVRKPVQSASNQTKKGSIPLRK